MRQTKKQDVSSYLSFEDYGRDPIFKFEKSHVYINFVVDIGSCDSD